MNKIAYQIDVCTDCIYPIAYGDFTGLDYYYSDDEAGRREREIKAGMKKLTTGRRRLVVSGETTAFSKRKCDCCGSKLAGERHKVALFKAAGETN